MIFQIVFCLANDDWKRLSNAVNTQIDVGASSLTFHRSFSLYLPLDFG